MLDRSMPVLWPVGSCSSGAKEAVPEFASGAMQHGHQPKRQHFDLPRGGALDEARSTSSCVVRRPAAFLDRDGVLNANHGFVHKPEQFDWLPGAMAAVRLLNEAGFFVFVVTNQSGIGHGYYDIETMHELHRWLCDRLAEHDAFIDGFYWCPFHPRAKLPQFRRQHPDRKPGAGMLERAFADWPVDRTKSFLIGDRNSDLAAAAAAGIPGVLFEGPNLETLVRRILQTRPADVDGEAGTDQ